MGQTPFDKLIRGALVGALLFSAACSGEQRAVESNTEMIDPNEVSLAEYVHETLPEDLLVRIRGITDVFEPIDGISYEQAVDLYRRDVNPESEIIIWEEMAHTYKAFREDQLWPLEKKQEVYKAVLLTTMFPEEEVFGHLEPEYLTIEDVKKIRLLYRLDPQAVKVTQE